MDGLLIPRSYNYSLSIIMRSIMDHFFIMYLEVSFLCIMLLLYIIRKASSNVERRHHWQFFQWALNFFLAFIVSDLVCELGDRGFYPGDQAFAKIATSLYYLFYTLGAACWYYFTEIELETHRVGKDKKYMIVTSIPVFILSLLLCSNYVTGSLFYITKQGEFHRGYLNLVTYIIPCFYLCLASTRAFMEAFKKENYVNKNSYLNLAFFALTTIGFCIVQFFYGGSPLPCIGITMASVMAFINPQQMQVSLDPLTQLNNRQYMIRYLSYKMAHRTSGMFLYLMIIDLDEFKEINDTYGHVEGDQALMRLTAVLKDTASAFRCFVSRYGGDEFIIIHEAANELEMQALIRHLHEKLDEANRNSDAEYKIQISTGYAQYDESIRYVPEFIECADKSLYKNKKRKKKV